MWPLQPVFRWALSPRAVLHGRLKGRAEEFPFRREGPGNANTPHTTLSGDWGEKVLIDITPDGSLYGAEFLNANEQLGSSVVAEGAASTLSTIPL